MNENLIFIQNNLPGSEQWFYGVSRKLKQLWNFCFNKVWSCAAFFFKCPPRLQILLLRYDFSLTKKKFQWARSGKYEILG